MILSKILIVYILILNTISTYFKNQVPDEEITEYIISEPKSLSNLDPKGKNIMIYYSTINESKGEVSNCLLFKFNSSNVKSIVMGIVFSDVDLIDNKNKTSSLFFLAMKPDYYMKSVDKSSFLYDSNEVSTGKRKNTLVFYISLSDKTKVIEEISIESKDILAVGGKNSNLNIQILKKEECFYRKIVFSKEIDYNSLLNIENELAVNQNDLYGFVSYDRLYYNYAEVNNEKETFVLKNGEVVQYNLDWERVLNKGNLYISLCNKSSNDISLRAKIQIVSSQIIFSGESINVNLNKGSFVSRVSKGEYIIFSSNQILYNKNHSLFSEIDPKDSLTGVTKLTINENFGLKTLKITEKNVQNKIYLSKITFPDLSKANNLNIDLNNLVAISFQLTSSNNIVLSFQSLSTDPAVVDIISYSQDIKYKDMSLQQPETLIEKNKIKSIQVTKSSKLQITKGDVASTENVILLIYLYINKVDIDFVSSKDKSNITLSSDSITTLGYGYDNTKQNIYMKISGNLKVIFSEIKSSLISGNKAKIESPVLYPLLKNNINTYQSYTIEYQVNDLKIYSDMILITYIGKGSISIETTFDLTDISKKESLVFDRTNKLTFNISDFKKIDVSSIIYKGMKICFLSYNDKQIPSNKKYEEISYRRNSINLSSSIVSNLNYIICPISRNGTSSTNTTLLLSKSIYSPSTKYSFDKIAYNDLENIVFTIKSPFYLNNAKEVKYFIIKKDDLHQSLSIEEFLIQYSNDFKKNLIKSKQNENEHSIEVEVSDEEKSIIQIYACIPVNDICNDAWKYENFYNFNENIDDTGLSVIVIVLVVIFSILALIGIFFLIRFVLNRNKDSDVSSELLN